MNTHIGSTQDNEERDMDDHVTYALSVQAMQQASRRCHEEKSRPDARRKQLNVGIRNTAKKNLRS